MLVEAEVLGNSAKSLESTDGKDGAGTGGNVHHSVPPDGPPPSTPTLDILDATAGSSSSVTTISSTLMPADQIPDTTSRPASTSTLTNKDGDARSESSNSGPSEGLGQGAKIGLGVGIPIALILVGLLAFFLLRRKRKALRHGKGDLGDPTIVTGKHYDDGHSGASDQMMPGVHVQQSPMTQHVHQGHMYSPAPLHPIDGGSRPVSGSPMAMVGGPPTPGYGYPHPASPSMTPSTIVRPATTMAHDMDRPVSPVQDVDLLGGADSGSLTGSSSAEGANRSLDRAGSAAEEDDREMQWILEEERKARERREQAMRLPTGR